MLQELSRLPRSKSLIVCIAVTFPMAAAAQTKLYVSPWGNDSWSGTLDAPNSDKSDGPKKSLTGARDAIRQLKASGGLSSQGAIVEIADGRYYTTGLVEFNAQDSGTPTAPIVYRAAHNWKAILEGTIAVTNFKTPSPDLLARIKPAARPYVIAADLKELGVGFIGQLPISHWTGNKNAIPSEYNEIYCNGLRQTIARWPNTGYARVKVDGSTTSFQTDLSASRVAPNDPNVQIFSFASGFDWAFQALPANVDVSSGSVNLPTPLVYPAKANARYYLRNSLEELDVPGEYYIDPASSTLLWYPGKNQDPTLCRIVANGADVEDAKRLIRVRGASNLTFQGISIFCARGSAVTIEDSSNINLVGMAIRKVSSYGVTVDRSTNCTIDSCTMEDLGEGGVLLGGGDLQTLTPGNNVVTNSRIWNIGRFSPSYRAGVVMVGVGNTATHNDISQTPHDGILVQGNNMTVEDNYITKVCQDTMDAGAIYVAGNVQFRGTVIRGNLIEDVKNMINQNGIWGVYLDARASHVLVENNIVRRTDFGYILNAGRNNTFRNNIAQDCPRYAYQFDHRYFQDYQGLSILSSLPIGLGQWEIQYPELTNLLLDDPTYAKYNTFQNNASLNCVNQLLWRDSLPLTKVATTKPTGMQIGWINMVNAQSGLFTGEGSGDYTPVAGSALATGGFTPLSDKTAGVVGNDFITGRLNTGP